MSSAFLGGTLALACAAPEQGRREAAAPDTSRPAASPAPGIRFDPAAVEPGDRVGDLVADSVAARLALDSTWVGMARFRGELVLSGRTVKHHDSEVTDACFEADSASATRMPRWAGDERRPWFCFTNSAVAFEALGRTPRAATIVVARFTIQRGLSDEVNSADFVRELGH